MTLILHTYFWPIVICIHRKGGCFFYLLSSHVVTEETLCEQLRAVRRTTTKRKTRIFPFENLHVLSNVSNSQIFISFIFLRAVVGVNRVCPVWGSTGLPEEEPWIK